MDDPKPRLIERPRAVFLGNGDLLRMSAAVRADIHRDTLKKKVPSSDS